MPPSNKFNLLNILRSSLCKALNISPPPLNSLLNLFSTISGNALCQYIAVNFTPRLSLVVGSFDNSSVALEKLSFISFNSLTLSKLPSFLARSIFLSILDNVSNLQSVNHLLTFFKLSA